jgi:hypothetical protein
LKNAKEVWVLSIEHLIAIHTSKTEKAKHYSQKLTFYMAVVCFIFFGTIFGYKAMATSAESVTAMAIAVPHIISSTPTASVFQDITGFVTAVKASPQVTEIKLFFYTAWILAVLIGTAISYEFRERF